MVITASHVDQMGRGSEYRLVEAKGVAVVLINNGKVLLMKRRNLPFLKNPGIWSFIFGHKEKGEGYEETAYREAREEAGLQRGALHPLCKSFGVVLFDRRKRIKWHNRMFIFRSDSSEVRKDFENAAYRWATMGEIMEGESYTNIFIDEERILKRINRYARWTAKP